MMVSEAAENIHIEQKFNRLFAKFLLSELFANIQAKNINLVFENQFLPCTQVDEIMPNCFTVSPHALMIDYAKDELDKLPRYQKYGARALMVVFSELLRLCQIDRIVTLNNQCLSTNMLSANFIKSDVIRLTDFATQKWHTHQLAIRSLNHFSHANFIKNLQHNGWLLLVTRQVYIMHDWQAVFAKNNTRRDKKLLTDGKYYFVKLESDSTDEQFYQAQHWYNRLYLYKYSWQNVQFSPIFLKQAVVADILLLYLMYDSQMHNSVGVVGIILNKEPKNIQATVPIIGYDDRIPQTQSLYRRCMAFALQVCAENQAVLNFSSGASDFKTVRGAIPQLEYMAVYCQHLPFYRRWIWWILTVLSQKYYASMLVKYKL